MPIWRCGPLIYSFKLYICQDPRIVNAYTARKKNALLACLVQRPSSFTSTYKTDMAERGALESPPEDGARTNGFNREIPARESHTEAETEKAPDRIRKKEWPNVYYKKWKYTPAVRSKISSKLIFASCVWYSDRAYYELCVLIKDISRRLPLQLQRSYQGQQGDVSQSVRGNYKTRFWGGQNMTAVKGKSIRLSSSSCKSNNRWGGGGVLKDVGAWLYKVARGVADLYP